MHITYFEQKLPELSAIILFVVAMYAYLMNKIVFDIQI